MQGLWNPSFHVTGPYTVYVPLIIFFIGKPPFSQHLLNYLAFSCHEPVLFVYFVNPCASIPRAILVPMGSQSHVQTCPDSEMVGGGERYLYIIQLIKHMLLLIF